MGDLHDGELIPALEKDPLELGVEDVYDISYVIGKDLLKMNKGGKDVSDLQFKIVRVLEMLELIVSKYNVTVEELRLERENLRGELNRVVTGSLENGNANNIIGPDTLLIDLKDPNRPRFTMQELKDVLQERNRLKAQLLVAQEELQLYKSGVLPQLEPNMVEVELGTSSSMDLPLSVPSKENREQNNDERSTIRKLFSFRRK